MQMTKEDHVLIIGGGQAAVQAVQRIRRHGFEGALTIVCDEDSPPYQRPPLSKAYLKGELARERLFLKPTKFYTDHSIDLRLETRVTAIDRNAKSVTLDTGDILSYSKLIIATGATPRPLPVPGADLENILNLKTIADTDKLRPHLEESRTLVVIGGGYIGLECAATARILGLNVTLVERMPRLLARVTSDSVSAFMDRVHRDKGVTIRYEMGVDAFVGENGQVTGVVLSSGETIPADLVLVGIGVIPNQSLAEDAGIACGNGILSDADAVTSDPDIYAIGDCSCHPVEGYGDAIRLESVHNALDQADKAAAHICNQPRPLGDTPWFWSDQYDIKLQTVGLFNGFTDFVVRGDQAARKFSIFYFEEDALIAVDSINDPPSFLAAKQILKLSVPVTKDQARDTDFSLKDQIKAFKAKQGD